MFTLKLDLELSIHVTVELDLELSIHVTVELDLELSIHVTVEFSWFTVCLIFFFIYLIAVTNNLVTYLFGQNSRN